MLYMPIQGWEKLFPPSQISQWSKGIRPPDTPHLVWAQKWCCSFFLSAWANNQPVIFGKVLHGDGRPGSCYYGEWLSFPLVWRSNDTKKKVREWRCLFTLATRAAVVLPHTNVFMPVWKSVQIDFLNINYESHCVFIPKLSYFVENKYIYKNKCIQIKY